MIDAFQGPRRRGRARRPRFRRPGTRCLCVWPGTARTCLLWAARVTRRGDLPDQRRRRSLVACAYSVVDVGSVGVATGPIPVHLHQPSPRLPSSRALRTLGAPQRCTYQGFSRSNEAAFGDLMQYREACHCQSLAFGVKIDFHAQPRRHGHVRDDDEVRGLALTGLPGRDRQRQRRRGPPGSGALAPGSASAGGRGCR
jgi:hypothetical protein